MNLLKSIPYVGAIHREFRAVLAELNSYSDRELNELGLARGDVARVAYAKRSGASDDCLEPRRRPRPGRAELCPDACLLGCSGRPRAASAQAAT